MCWESLQTLIQRIRTKQTSKVILYFELNVNEIFRQGKNYAWPRPGECPKCGSCRLWGHGYVQRYFEGFECGLWLKRYRCDDCNGVHTIRPKKYWRRFQASIKTIVESLCKKLSENQWQAGSSRQKQQYWFRGFKKQLLRAEVFWEDRITQLGIFLKEGIVASSHSMRYYSTKM